MGAEQYGSARAVDQQEVRNQVRDGTPGLWRRQMSSVDANQASASDDAARLGDPRGHGFDQTEISAVAEFCRPALAESAWVLTGSARPSWPGSAASAAVGESGCAV